MIRANMRVRTLGIVLALMMVPLFMGLVCPCAQAAPAATVIENIPCHGCCPEMVMNTTDCQARILRQPVVLNSAGISGFLSGRDLNLESLLSVSQDQVSQVSQADVSGPPAYPLHESLVVLNQVFRI